MQIPFVSMGHTNQNITYKEKEALESLQKDRSIIIKEEDKGS